MKHESRFGRFLDNVSLNPTRVDRIESAISHLKKFVRDDNPISAVFIDLFEQGSWALTTAIRPLNEQDEFDVDLVLLLEVGLLPHHRRSPENVIAWIADRLRTDDDYEGKVSIKKRCVRIDYAGEFHLDIVPAAPVADGILKPVRVPNRENGTWQVSDPLGYADWFKYVSSTCDGMLPSVVKSAKYWQSLKVADRSRPRSILLTTLLGQRVAIDHLTEPEVFVTTLENLSDYLNSLSAVPWIANPTLSSEDLARDWTVEQFEVYRAKLGSAVMKGQKALEEPDSQKSAKLWRDLFGRAYPLLSKKDEEDKISEAGELSRGIREKNVYVTSGGAVTLGEPDEGGVLVTHHRSHGEDF